MWLINPLQQSDRFLCFHPWLNTPDSAPVDLLSWVLFHRGVKCVWWRGDKVADSSIFFSRWVGGWVRSNGCSGHLRLIRVISLQGSRVGMHLITLAWYSTPSFQNLTKTQTLSYQMEGPHMSSTHADLCWVFSYWPCAHISAPLPYHSNIIVRFADNTTVLGLICGADVTANRQEVQKLVAWCSVVNLLLTTGKTKKMVMAWKKNRAAHDPVHINSVPACPGIIKLAKKVIGLLWE